MNETQKNIIESGDIIRDITSFIRSIRTQYNLDKKASLRLFIDFKICTTTAISLCNMDSIILKMGNISEIEYDIYTLLQDGNYFEHTNISGFDIYLELPSIDKDTQEKSIDSEITRLNKQIFLLSNKLKNEEFLKKAPIEIIEKETEKLEYLSSKVESLNSLNLYRKCGLIYLELLNRLGLNMLRNFIEYEGYSDITPESINNLHKKIYTK